MRKGCILKEVRVVFLLFSIFLFISLFSQNVFSSSYDWWNGSWNYRMDVNVSTSTYSRENSPVELYVNFTNELSSLTSEMFDNNSVRVVEYNATGSVLYEIASQFDELENYNSENAVGTVIWLLNGTTAASETRYFQIYFDTTSDSKTEADYNSFINYSWSGEEVSVNNSVLELKIDTDKNDVSGLYYAKRSSKEIFNGVSDTYPIEYSSYSNGSKLTYNLKNNATVISGPIRLTITQSGDEILFGDASITTGEANITKKYYIYKDNPWIKIKHTLTNKDASSIERYNADVWPLTIDAERGFGIDFMTSPQEDPYSWSSVYTTAGELGLGVINLNESGTSNFQAYGSVTLGFVGIRLSDSTVIPSGDSLTESAAILFNNESSHTPVENLKNRFQTPLTITKSNCETYTATSETLTPYEIYNLNDNLNIRVNITQDTQNLVRYVTSILDLGTISELDDVSVILYDDGTHGDVSNGDSIYTNEYSFLETGAVGSWTITSNVYDGTYFLLNQTQKSIELSNQYYSNLSIVNPAGQIERTIYGNISVSNCRNDTGITSVTVNCSYNGTQVTQYSDTGLGNYTLNFTAPSTPGTYELSCIMSKYNNSGTDSQLFTVDNPTTNLELVLTPNSTIVENITQRYAQNFTINVSINNPGQSTAYYSNLTLSLPENWTAYPSYYYCGNITQSGSCDHSFNITVAKAYVPNNYMVTAEISWINLNTSINSTQDSSTIEIENTPVLEVSETSISGIVPEGSSALLDNFTINSTGNGNLSTINFTCQAGTACDNLTIIFSPTSLIGLELSNTYEIEINITVPEGLDTGNYSGIINVSSSNGGSDIFSVNISVPESDAWSISSQTCSINALSDFIGSVCNLTLSNLGNTQVNLTLSPEEGNYTKLNETSIVINAQSSAVLEVSYNSTNAGVGTYNSTYTINSTGTPTQRTLNVSLSIVVGPTITSLIELENQQGDSVNLLANLQDLSLQGISTVNATIVQPNGTIQYVNLTNITQNSAGGFSNWSYSYNNTLQRGRYNVTLNAIDNGGGPRSLVTYFMVYAYLNASLSTNWAHYFTGETATINAGLEDYNSVSLSGNVSILVLYDTNVLLNESHKVINGVLDVVPTFQIASDGNIGNYTLKAISKYYDAISDINVTKTEYFYFTVHKALEMDLETSIVWYPENTMRFYILLYGNGNITSEVDNTSLNLKVYDPAENLFFSVSKDNLTVFDQTSDSILYKYAYALPTPVTTGLYLAKITKTQGDRNEIDLTSFRVSSGGPYDVVIESITSEAPQGDNMNFSIRIENKGDVSQDVSLDYWVSDASGTVYDSVSGEAVYVASDSNRSFSRSLFIGSSQALGTYYLNVKMTYSSIQPCIETNRTFSVIEPSEQVETPSSGGRGGIPSAGAVEEPNYELQITKLYPENIMVERGGVRYLTVEVKNTGNQDLHDLTAFIDNVPGSWFKSASLNSLKEKETSTFLIKLDIPKDEVPSEVKGVVKVLSERTTAEKELSLQIFESKEELIQAIINKNKKTLEELELLATQKSKELDVSVALQSLEQANDLIQLSEKNLEDGNLIKAMNFIEEAENSLERASYILGVRT